MFRFFAEWNDAPGVKDPILAATWARLEITHDSPAGTQWLSRLIRPMTNGLDRGVYGSVFPLAEWIVENWWFLLYESCRVPRFDSGRRLASNPAQREWVQRHNLLAAQAGGALPDVTLFRDGDVLVVKWAPDPDQDERVRPVRFIEQGTALVDPSEVERSLHDLVEAVLGRVADRTDEAANRLRTEWAAVCESRHSELSLCARSASLGLDPYSEWELTDELVELLESHVGGLPPRLEHDLLEATSGDALSTDFRWLDQALSLASDSLTAGGEVTKLEAPTAHQMGYQRAAWFRQHFSLPSAPVFDLSAILHKRCGWPAPGQQTATIDGTNNVSALVAKDRDSRPQIIGPSLGHWAERFRLARALYFLPDASQAWPHRLVTRAYTWDQRASRAFAAELLAPAEALRAQIGSVVSADAVDFFARQFDVRPSLIEHQIRNHRLAWLEED